MGVSFYIDTGLFDPSMLSISTWRSVNSYLLLGPLLLLFVIKLEDSERKVRWLDSLHLIPFVVGFALLLPALLEDPSLFLQAKADRIEHIAIKPVTARFTLAYLLPATHFIAYILFSSWSVFRFWLQNRIQPIYPQLYWSIGILVMTYLMMLNIFIVLFVAIINQVDKPPTIFALANLSVIIGLFWVTYLLIHIGRPKPVSQRANVVSVESGNGNTEKNTKEVNQLTVAPLTFEQQQGIAKIDQLMTHTSIFLDPDLNQGKLAAELQISRHQLSELLAIHPSGNFYELINMHRIKAVINEIKKRPINAKLTVIAYDCGFNSKSSFNQVFKKHLNQTPSQFRKSLKGQVD